MCIIFGLALLVAWLVPAFGWLIPLVMVILNKKQRKSARAPGIIVAVWLPVSCVLFVITHALLTPPRPPHAPGPDELEQYSGMYHVDRARVGLPPLPKGCHRITIQDQPCCDYDSQIAIHCPHEARQINFRRVNGTYRWVGENVWCYSGRRFIGWGQLLPEQLSIRSCAGRLAGGTHISEISYQGPDDMDGRSGIGYGEAMQTIESWEKEQARHGKHQP